MRVRGISKSSIQRIIKKYHPYRIQLYQLVTHNDANRRLEFCLWVLDECNEDLSFPNYVMFADEFSFHNTGLVNRRNLHFYGTENPHFSRSSHHQLGIKGKHVFGPNFFPRFLMDFKVEATFYLFLKRKLLEEIPLETRKKCLNQRYGVGRMSFDYCASKF